MNYKRYDDKEKMYFVPSKCRKTMEKLLSLHKKRGFKSTPIVMMYMASIVIEKSTGAVLKNRYDYSRLFKRRSKRADT